MGSGAAPYAAKSPTCSRAICGGPSHPPWFGFAHASTTPRTAGALAIQRTNHRGAGCGPLQLSRGHTGSGPDRRLRRVVREFPCGSAPESWNFRSAPADRGASEGHWCVQQRRARVVGDRGLAPRAGPRGYAVPGASSTSGRGTNTMIRDGAHASNTEDILDTLRSAVREGLLRGGQPDDARAAGRLAALSNRCSARAPQGQRRCRRREGGSTACWGRSEWSVGLGAAAGPRTAEAHEKGRAGTLCYCQARRAPGWAPPAGRPPAGSPLEIIGGFRPLAPTPGEKTNAKAPENFAHSRVLGGTMRWRHRWAHPRLAKKNLASATDYEAHYVTLPAKKDVVNAATGPTGGVIYLAHDPDHAKARRSIGHARCGQRNPSRSGGHLNEIQVRGERALEHGPRSTEAVDAQQPAASSTLMGSGCSRCCGTRSSRCCRRAG